MPPVNGDSGISPYEEAMEALSSLITKRSRADTSNKGGNFETLFDYVKILELEEAIKEMKVIHVAGTKGKGSTCTFSESILRHCGFRTGLFTSPHLIDVRERFKLDGSDISQEKFLEYFWWCFNRFKENVTEELPMPTYFRFLALLAFKIFAAEKVDVVILEVGLGGKFDATNIVENPVVCGIASLGYDHMEILGNTLGEIAGEKAGIFKRGSPAFTVPQPEEAMKVLEQKAADLDINLQVAAPLDPRLMSNMHLGLEGEHQYLNAGLAIALCSTWLQRTSHVRIEYYNTTASLPDEFIRGLASAWLYGRAQIVADQFIENENPGGLVFYLDGAHSPESMDVCAKWFCNATKGDTKPAYNVAPDESNASVDRNQNGSSAKVATKILLFNCMSVRDPQMLLPRLMKTCANHGVHFNKAIFVPNTSVYHKVGNVNSPSSDAQVDVSWQKTLQRVWEGLVLGDKGSDAKDANSTCKAAAAAAPATDNDSGSCTIIFPSLPQAINWLRDSIRKNQSARLQVLVTGSLHLVGDVLGLIKN